MQLSRASIAEVLRSREGSPEALGLVLGAYPFKSKVNRLAGYGFRSYSSNSRGEPGKPVAAAVNK
jgi:hypothetical protein